ncbi:MAG: hypothetical protein HY255_08765 [Betaproteobacteria bacterium]|nr:hypothetical protein [Betaproteobacteria bacterium]
MDSILFEYGDTILLLLAAAAIYDGVRHLAVYGPGKRSFWTLFLSAIVCFSSGLHFEALYRAESKPDRLGTPRMVVAYSSGAPDVVARQKEKAEKSAAQFNFVQAGVISEYTAINGERVRYEPTIADMTQRTTVLAERLRLGNAARVDEIKAKVWWLFWIPAALAGYLLGRREYAYLVTRHQFVRVAKPQTYAEVEGFVGLLKAACEDPAVNSTLEVILSQSNEGRKRLIQDLLTRFREKRAPQMLIDAFVCLMDDEVAEKVYVFIHKCERPLAVAA